MKLIIAGSRSIVPSSATLSEYLKLVGFDPTKDSVISGGADGVDSSAAIYCLDRGIPIDEFLPDWKTHGKAAGPIRNAQMAAEGDILLLLWDGVSRGSASMKAEMEKLGKPVFEVIIK